MEFSIYLAWLTLLSCQTITLINLPSLWFTVKYLAANLSRSPISKFQRLMGEKWLYVSTSPSVYEEISK